MSDYHHTNLSNILFCLPVPTGSVDAVVMFLGHNSCTCTISAAGVADTANNVIVINNLDHGPTQTPDYTQVSYQNTLVHEIGHLFYVDDHYGETENDYVETTEEMNEKYNTNTFSDACLYGPQRFAKSFIENLVICQGCCAFIDENANKFYDVDE